MSSAFPSSSGDASLEQLAAKLESALRRLEQASPFAKLSRQGAVLALARRVLERPGGVELLFGMAGRFDAAGLFQGSDWDNPDALLPGLVAQTLQNGEPATVVLECLSELRLLAVANGEYSRRGVSSEQARHFLTQVLALNLTRAFGGARHEAERVRLGALGGAVDETLQFILSHIGFRDILSSLVDEVWRILTQRPVQVNHVKGIIAQISMTLAQGAGDLGEARIGADRLISALFGPTQTCLDDPGLAVFRSRLKGLDHPTLQHEARGFARAMHDSGLVSDYHADFLRWLLENDQQKLLPDALGLDATGRDVLRRYPDVVHRIVLDAVYPETAQAVYGLALFLERGTLYDPQVAPALWRQIGLEPCPAVAASLTAAFGDRHPPRVFLLAGVVTVLGLPFGVGQGNNPSCQAARAISMWSYTDPDYLLHLVAQAARTNRIFMHFEGRPLDSGLIAAGLIASIPLDTDPVSTLLVPHIDRIYNEMGRLCADRPEDPHRWINPELHGWWVGRTFVIAVDVATGALKDHLAFLRHFYGSYHPDYNGGQPVIHPQPAGLAVTDSNAAFVGWHAITLIRVAPDQEGVMRVYFYNPNNDSGQNWGNGVVVSTQGRGERFGEASLPFAELASRLYIFHDDPVEGPRGADVAASELEQVHEMAYESWAAGRAHLAPTGIRT